MGEDCEESEPDKEEQVERGDEKSKLKSKSPKVALRSCCGCLLLSSQRRGAAAGNRPLASSKSKGVKERSAKEEKERNEEESREVGSNSIVGFELEIAFQSPKVSIIVACLLACAGT